MDERLRYATIQASTEHAWCLGCGRVTFEEAASISIFTVTATYRNFVAATAFSFVAYIKRLVRRALEWLMDRREKGIPCGVADAKKRLRTILDGHAAYRGKPLWIGTLQILDEVTADNAVAVENWRKSPGLRLNVARHVAHHYHSSPFAEKIARRVTREFRRVEVAA